MNSDVMFLSKNSFVSIWNTRFFTEHEVEDFGDIPSPPVSYFPVWVQLSQWRKPQRPEQTKPPSAAPPAHPAAAVARADPALPRSTVSRLGCSLLVGVSLVVLIRILPMANVVEQDDLFMCLLAVCMSSLENCLIRPFTHLKIWLSFYYWGVRVLYIF